MTRRDELIAFHKQLHEAHRKACAEAAKARDADNTYAAAVFSTDANQYFSEAQIVYAEIQKEFEKDRTK